MFVRAQHDGQGCCYGITQPFQYFGAKGFLSTLLMRADRRVLYERMESPRCASLMGNAPCIYTATPSGVSGISARGVLKVRPHTKSGGESTSGPIYEKWGGGGGGNSLQVRYEK